MIIAKDRIYIKEWLELKPYDKQIVTDNYYLKLSNDVKKTIVSNKQSFILQKYLDKDEINLLACFLTSYFEDIISKTNIWNIFVTYHKKLYNKQVPFYNLDAYYEKEINQQDVSFLIWYFINTVQNEKFVSPYNDFIIETAGKVINVLDDAWDYAPESEYLKSFYTIDENETDFYIARKLIDNIMFKSYLFFPDVLLDLRDAEYDIFEEHENNDDINPDHLIQLLNEIRDYTLHNKCTSLLSLKGKEWASEILGKSHSLSKDYNEISQKIQSYFLYKGQDENDVFIEHIASGKAFKLTKKSLDHYNELKDIDTVLFMGIVKWQGEWWFSGVYFQRDFDPDLVLDEKNSIKSRVAVNFLDHQEKDMDEMLGKQLKAFKEYNNDSQIAFMESEKIDAFIKGYYQYFNDSLNLSDKEKREARQRAKNDGFFGTEEESKDFSEVSETALIFFNPKSGVEIALAVNSAFSDANNPFYNEEESTEHIKRLLLEKDLSTELAMYCIDNYKTKLQFFKEGEGKMYLKDIDFLLRFWKKDHYWAKPTITFTGEE